MKKSQKGYSLVTMIVAVIVILIITGGAISTINVSMEEKKINNFIYDINNIESAVKEYYTATGTIPSLGDAGDVSAMGAQIDPNDGNVYFRLDLSKLDLNEVHETDKIYVINESSLKVYLLEGITYKGDTYYTVNDNLMGTNTNYSAQTVDLVCTTSPNIWTDKVYIRAILPNESSTSGWTFKYSTGPKDASDFAKDGTIFSYGSSITVETNGVYTIYAKDPSGNEVVKNVVINNIDKISPKYELVNGNFTFSDAETGIREIRYKTYEKYNENMGEYSAQGKTGSKMAYYLLGGKGNTVESLKTDIANYKSRLQTIQNSRTARTTGFNALTDEEKEIQRDSYEAEIQNLDIQETELKNTYAHIISGSTRYVLYVEDYAGNAILVDESALTFEKVCQTFNISTSGLEI